MNEIHVAAEPSAPTKPLTDVLAVAGRGLDGDRHAGTADHQLSLIEAEALEAAARDYDVVLDGGESRRNVVTVGVPLGHLVGVEFMVGEVLVRGTELCEPCAHLQELTGRHVVRALRHRGGLYADILTTGTIRTGDVVRPLR